MRVGWALEYVTWPETRRTILLWRLCTINHLAEISRSIIPAPRTRIHNHRVPSSDTPQGVAARRDRRGAWGRTQNLRHRVRRKWSPSLGAEKQGETLGIQPVRSARSSRTGQGPPVGSSGACGGRTIRQSACAKIFIIDESCLPNGSAISMPVEEVSSRARI
jgi:hypothetical protein